MAVLKVILLDTLQKEIRSKTLLWVMIINVFFILLVSGGISYLSQTLDGVGVPVEMKNKSIFIISFFISFWTGILSILFGGSCIRTDEESGIIGQILSLPISRFQYLIGRILGTTLISTTFFIILNLFALIVVFFAGDDFPFLSTFPIGVLASVASIFGLVVLSSTVSMFMNRTLGFILMVLFYLFLSSSEALFFGEEVSKFTTDLGFFKLLSLICYSLFPHVSTLSNLSSKLTVGSDYTGFNYLLEFFHYLFSIGIFGFILNKIFSKKEV